MDMGFDMLYWYAFLPIFVTVKYLSIKEDGGLVGDQQCFHYTGVCYTKILLCLMISGGIACLSHYTWSQCHCHVS